MRELTLHTVARPGMLISQVSPKAMHRPGETLRAVEETLSTGFFQALQTASVTSSRERHQIAESIQDQGVVMTYCVASLQNQLGLNPSSLDADHRKASVQALMPSVDEAREQGATYLMLLSGRAPEQADDRVQAMAAFAESLGELARAGAPDLVILVEPLDVSVHKKGTVGSTDEAIRLLGDLKAAYPNIGLCLDTSHMILNGEDPAESLRRAQAMTAQLHLCNCCLDESHALYGDQHIPLGPPGPLDLDAGSQILAQASDMGFLNPDSRPGVFYETLNRDMPLEGAIQMHIDTLQRMWETAQSKK